MRAQADRVIVVVLDGLRPDAIAAFGLNNLARLCESGAHTLTAQTVQPSVTACAMTSLFTGATPDHHGIKSDKFGLPTIGRKLDPIPKVLERHGFTSAAHMSRIPFVFRALARSMARFAGLNDAGFHGEGCADIVEGARRTIETQASGFILLHWPDVDRAGHAHGWMSPQYGDTARRMDAALGKLVDMIDFKRHPRTVLIALADHGGGGTNLKRHDSSSPIDLTIPVVIAGHAVSPGPLSGPVSLLDVPATVLWALGVPRPDTYAGKPLVHAFLEARAAA